MIKKIIKEKKVFIIFLIVAILVPSITLILRFINHDSIIIGEQPYYHLRIAKELLETRFHVKITSIEFEDGTGSKFIVTTANNPGKRQFVKL